MSIVCSLFHQAGGVRVPPGFAAGGEPVATAAGKHRDLVPPQAPATQFPGIRLPRSTKRSFRRARNRAHASPLQGTWYKGKWHSASTLGHLPKPTPDIPRSTAKRAVRRTTLDRHLRILSWNAGGLTSSMYQEFLAWCETCAELDIVVVQESHWHETSDYYAGPWLAMHTSGRCDPDGFGRNTGLLFLLKRKTFQDPRFLDINPGRLALVQATHRDTQIPVSIVGIYQHVWRTHLTSSRNRELRQTIWAQLDTTLHRIPSRHALLICGDFNSTLTCEPPLVGSAVPKCSSRTEDGLQALLYKHSLCALNTWHCKPHCTYHSSSGQTQIDYVLSRCADTGHHARTAYPDHAFPVGSDRLSGHFPIRVSYPIRPFSWRRTRPAQTPAYNAQALCSAVRSGAPLAQELQHRVGLRLQDVDASVLSTAHQHVNRILLEETCALFPAQPAPDHRISAQPAFRVTARTVWGLYHAFKRSGVCTFRNIFAKWRLATQFASASKALRQSSQRLKKQVFQGQVEDAELAASRGDQRGLHLIVRRLSPRTRQLAGRLRDDSGRLLTRDEELEAIIQYGNATFAKHHDDHPILPLAQDVVIPAADLAAELSKLGPAKAVPKHIAPSAVWKLCSSDLGEVLSHALTLHLRRGTSAPLDTDWKDCSVVWIPKPFEEVTELVSRTRATRFQQQAGQKTRGCAGGVSLSLDLSKAFDGVTRSHIYQEMKKQGVDSSVITIVQQLHHRARYIYRVGDSQGSTLTTNGIKQGCVIAPYLWNFFSLAFLLLLRDQRDLSWIQRVLSLFADDAWGAWAIASAADFQQALSDITLILEALESLHMIVNFDKTAILLHLVGKESKKLRRNHTFMKAGQLHLRLWVHGREQAIPIRDQHVYLGTIVTYHSRLERNMEHRIKAARANYQGLRKLLNGAHALDTDHRIRLWKACVCSSVMYSQHVVGVTAKTLKRLTTVLTRHLRAILRVPAHLTHVTNQAVWHQAGQPMPGWTIQCSLLQHQTKLQQTAASGTDITSTPQALAHVDILAGRLEALLLDAAQTLATEAVSAPSISCPHCSELFISENAVRIHCKLKHGQLPPRLNHHPTEFVPELHSTAGMPACRLCRRQFFRWSHLKLHIETGACAALGGDSMIRAPPSEAHAPAPIKPPPTAGLAVFAEENVMHLPLVKRQAFLASLGNWEKWLSVPELRQELKNYCSICHMMYGDPLTMDAFAHEEAEIFANLWTGPEPYLEDGRSQKRQRPEQHRWSMPPAQRPNQPHHRGGPPPSRPMHPLQNHINLLGRVVLQQEDIISRLRNDKNFVLFLRNDANGTLGTLMRISRDWKAKKSLEPEQLKSPLRTVLIACMIRELMNLAQQAVATEEARNKHVTSEWLNSAIRLLNFLLKCMTGDIVQRFAASKTLNFLEQQGAQVATFHLEISLRGSRAQEVYDALDRFTGNTLMNLIGVSMKRDTMPRSPLAKKLAEQVNSSESAAAPSVPLIEAAAARSLTADGMQVAELAPATKCLVLVNDPARHLPDVQELISAWHTQIGLQAYNKPPPWLFIQLPRFHYYAPGWPVKLQHAYILPSALRIPVFATADNMLVRWEQYRVIGFIQHHGSAPTAGHYTAVIRTQHDQLWLLDDEKAPCKLTDAQVDHASTNACILALVHCSAFHAPAGLLAAQSDDGIQHFANPAGNGPRLDLQQAQSSADASARTSDGTGTAATGPLPALGSCSDHGGSLSKERGT
ncbi:pol [Symbiodinium sp. CCMP2456]|nr:pol [Symbiodinium sp. CCMP2456]